MTTVVAERPIEKTIVSLIERNGLQRVDFTVTPKIINARAIPLAHHPQVAVNQQAALQKRAGQIGGSISMEEAQRIMETTRSAPIAVAYGDTFGEALKALGRELKALKG